jgi:hypothetical protein
MANQKGIAYNLATEQAYKFAFHSDENPILLINIIAEWVIERQGKKGTEYEMEQNYAVAAALKGAADMAYNNILWKYEDKEFVKAKNPTSTTILEVADLIFKSLMNKVIQR